MANIVSHSRRVAAVTLTTLALSRGTPIRAGIAAWAAVWSANQGSIVMLTVINTGITTVMEFTSRSIVAPLADNHSQYQFIVQDKDGSKHIHRQSLINIWMTFFASLLGGPVYFLRQRSQRFLFFICFGTFNSILGGTLSSLIRDGAILLIPGRILFDFIYSGTIKFLTFEYMRTSILRARKKAFRMSSLRVAQDLLNTMLRVCVLNLIGFKD